MDSNNETPGTYLAALKREHFADLQDFLARRFMRHFYIKRDDVADCVSQALLLLLEANQPLHKAPAFKAETDRNDHWYNDTTSALRGYLIGKENSLLFRAIYKAFSGRGPKIPQSSSKKAKHQFVSSSGVRGSPSNSLDDLPDFLEDPPDFRDDPPEAQDGPSDDPSDDLPEAKDKPSEGLPKLPDPDSTSKKENVQVMSIGQMDEFSQEDRQASQASADPNELFEDHRSGQVIYLKLVAQISDPLLCQILEALGMLARADGISPQLNVEGEAGIDERVFRGCGFNNQLILETLCRMYPDDGWTIELVHYYLAALRKLCEMIREDAMDAGFIPNSATRQEKLYDKK